MNDDKKRVAVRNEMATPSPHGYSADLYCQFVNGAHPFGATAKFAGSDRADVMRQIKQAGWALDRDNFATCPACIQALGLGKKRGRARWARTR